MCLSPFLLVSLSHSLSLFPFLFPLFRPPCSHHGMSTTSRTYHTLETEKGGREKRKKKKRENRKGKEVKDGVVACVSLNFFFSILHFASVFLLFLINLSDSSFVFFVLVHLHIALSISLTTYPSVSVPVSTILCGYPAPPVCSLPIHLCRYLAYLYLCLSLRSRLCLVSLCHSDAAVLPSVSVSVCFCLLALSECLLMALSQ